MLSATGKVDGARHARLAMRRVRHQGTVNGARLARMPKRGVATVTVTQAGALTTRHATVAG